MSVFSYMCGRYVDLPQNDFTRDYLWSLIKINSRDNSIICTSIGCTKIDFNDAVDANYKIECIIYDSDSSWDDESELGDTNHPNYWKDDLCKNDQGIYSGTLVIYDNNLENDNEDLVEYRLQFIPVSTIREKEGGIITNEEDF